MKIFYKDKANRGGIYKLMNITNGRIYIGSTSCFRKRALSHKNSLEMNRHGNIFLQNDFNKYGTDVFLFEVLEVVTEKEEKIRLEREQFYLNQFYDSQKQCYNLRKDVCDTRTGAKNLNPANRETDKRCKPHTEEHKIKQKESLKKTWQKEEYRELSKKRCEKRWKGYSANISVTNQETGETVLILVTVKQFCKERSLSYKAFNQLVKGKIKCSGGWFLSETPPTYVSQRGQKRKPLEKEHREKIAGGKYKGMLLENDKEETLTVEANIKEQCRNLKLHYTTFLKVLKGTCGSVGGWRLPLFPSS